LGDRKSEGMIALPKHSNPKNRLNLISYVSLESMKGTN
jgi:hypothetical protein